MYIRKISFFLLLSLIGFSGFANAEDIYIGGGGGFLDYSVEAINDDDAITALHGRLGTKLNDVLSAEVRAGAGLSRVTFSYLGTEIKYKVEKMLGVYLRAGLPVTESLFPYAVIGYSRGGIDADVNDIDLGSSTGEDASYGFGVDYLLNEKVSINLEYMNYFNKDGIEITGASYGFIYRF